MAAVTLSRLGKVFPDGTLAVSDLNLRVDDGELLVLVGPSGCGKTTTLRLTAGLEEATVGEIRIGERCVNELDPRQRDVAMVFQNYALYPHMSVFDNLAFPLRARQLPRAEIRGRVERTAELLGLGGLLARKPRALSGGQRQRVAMGRAIVREPEVFLMDEPLSNLDAKLRSQMRAEICTLQRQLGVTTMYVTHDQVEAMTMGTRIAVLRAGVLQQHDVPQSVYDAPANLFVAAFVGSPAMNLLRGSIASAAGCVECVLGNQRLPLGASGSLPALEAYAGAEVAVGVRPEHLIDADGAQWPRLRGRVRHLELLGAERLVQVELDARPVVVEDAGDGGATPEAMAALNRSMPEHAVVVARLGPQAPVGLDESIEISVVTTRLHFFDLSSGRVIPRS